MASKDNFQYRTEYRSFDGAQYITASSSAMDELVSGIPKEESFPNAKYIWPVGHRRFHAARVFSVSKKVARAEMAFLCDNLFDIWLNGKQVVCDAKHLPLVDITSLLITCI